MGAKAARGEKLVLVVTLTTIPSRFQGLATTLTSLVNQSRPADIIVLNLPKQYHARFGGATISEDDIAALALQFPQIHVLRPEMDEGPGTKLLGTLDAIVAHTPPLHRLPDASKVCIVIADDDRVYGKNQLQHIEQKYDGKTAVSGWVFEDQGVTIGQGADLFAIPLSCLGMARFFFNKISSSRACVLHDDFWISYYLRKMGVPIKAMPNDSPETKESFRDALHKLQGDDSRASVTREAHRILGPMTLDQCTWAWGKEVFVHDPAGPG